MYLFITGLSDTGNNLSFAINSIFMKLKLQEHNDTGLEYLTDGIRIRGRILNGVANIVFEGVEIQGNPYEDCLVVTLPDRYVPKSSVFFTMASNSLKPTAVSCRIVGNKVYCSCPENKNIVGSVSYLI